MARNCWGRSERALNYFRPHPAAVVGEIDLAATGHLGKGYELGAIESFLYERATLPTERRVADDFKILLGHYDSLVTVANTTLQVLAPISEAQFQQTALDKAQAKDKRGTVGEVEPPGGLPVPPKQPGKGASGYVRNPSIAAAALSNANFKCELDTSHPTFISSAKGLPYVEAHHLVPMGQQAQYPFSLDVTANIVALCPFCHKLLHHAKPKDKRTHLLKLLALREAKLQEKRIAVLSEVLLGYYNKDLLDDEA
jgi:5-methylcytosine-specific restriction enzyme A